MRCIFTSYYIPLVHISYMSALYKCLLSELCFDFTYKPLFFWDRDNDLHRLLFLPKGLRDGTKLAYCAKGKVVSDLIYFCSMILLMIFSSNPRNWSDYFYLTGHTWRLQAGEWYSLWSLWYWGSSISACSTIVASWIFSFLWIPLMHSFPFCWTD